MLNQKHVSSNIIMRLNDISFDESYKNLFQVDDPRLRADALKHSVVPRLRVILNECISLIKRVYDIEVLNDSRISCFPNFRQKRENELTHLYESAYASLGGKQEKGKWSGFNRKDGKVVQLLPFRYGLEISEDGLCIRLENYWTTGLTDESYRKLFAFHLEFEPIIHSLCYRTNMKPDLFYGNGCEPISTLQEHYAWMAENQIFDNEFLSENSSYPISADDILNVIVNYAIFYPVYDSYLQIAMDKSIRFVSLIKKLNDWLRAADELDGEEQVDGIDKPGILLSEAVVLKAKEAAEQKLKVMPAIRWQVFQRDNWKCVACGRDSQDGVILHVDHIIPRSKGGSDTIDNYQTLCHLCNIGKSNKDMTDLRIKSRKEIANRRS